jgi:nuclear pore complex protein Nup214
LEPQKTTVKRIAQQQRLKISSDLPFRSNKKMFDSQMAAILQEKPSDSSNSSIVESYVSRLHSPSEGKFLQVDLDYCGFCLHYGVFY